MTYIKRPTVENAKSAIPHAAGPNSILIMPKIQNFHCVGVTKISNAVAVTKKIPIKLKSKKPVLLVTNTTMLTREEMAKSVRAAIVKQPGRSIASITIKKPNLKQPYSEGCFFSTYFSFFKCQSGELLRPNLSFKRINDTFFLKGCQFMALIPAFEEINPVFQCNVH